MIQILSANALLTFYYIWSSKSVPDLIIQLDSFLVVTIKYKIPQPVRFIHLLVFDLLVRVKMECYW